MNANYLKITIIINNSKLRTEEEQNHDFQDLFVALYSDYI
jgi:hypothetical protein